MAKKQASSSHKQAAMQALLLDIPQACEVLCLSRATVYRLIYREGLPVVHFGRSVRVPVIALNDWLEQRRKSA